MTADPVLPHRLFGGERQAGADVFGRQLGEVRQRVFHTHAAGQVIQHVAHGDAHAADARLPAPLARFDRDESGAVHAVTLNQTGVAVNKAEPLGPVTAIS
jgi:hypothetical protein